MSRARWLAERGRGVSECSMDPGDPQKGEFDCSTDPGGLRMGDWMSLSCDIVAVGECSGDPEDHRKKALRPCLTRRSRSTARRGGARGQPQNRKHRCDASRGIRCDNAMMNRRGREGRSARSRSSKQRHLRGGRASRASRARLRAQSSLWRDRVNSLAV